MQEESISVVVDGEVRTTRPGTTVAELLGAARDPELVGALLNHDVVSLDEELTVPVTVAPVFRREREGRDIVRRTATHMLEAVLAREFPGLRFQIGQSLHKGYHYELVSWEGDEPDLEAVAARVDRHLLDLVKADLPLRRRAVTVEEASLLIADPGGSMTRLLETWPLPRVPVVELAGFTAIQHGPFLPSTAHAGPLRVVPFQRGMILQFSREGARPDPARSSRLVSAYRESREWNRMISVATVGDLNEAILEDRLGDVIRVQEGLHEKKIVQIADAISARRDKVRLVCVAGPSSSGKTTFVRRLSVQLQVTGITPVIVGLDDYYRNRDECPRDAEGKLDFEAVEALDVDLLARHLQALVAGQEVRVPRFDFTTGSRVPEARWKPLQLQKNQILLIEGIHGLNPLLSGSVPEETRYRIFVSALTQLVIDGHNRIPTSDGRLLRRIVRDRRYRGTKAAETIEMWPRVRRGEERYIFPFQEQCDVMFNSALVYEAAVLKTFAWRYLLEVPRQDPARVQAYPLLRFLDLFVPIFPDHVPSNSVLREFIGGSGFTY